MKYHEELGHFANWTSINHQRNHQLFFEPIVLFFEPIKKKVYQIDINVCFEPTIKRGTGRISQYFSIMSPFFRHVGSGQQTSLPSQTWDLTVLGFETDDQGRCPEFTV